MKAQRGSKGTAPLILRWRWVVKFKAHLPYARERSPVSTEQGSEGNPVPVWTFSRKENLFPVPGSEPMTILLSYTDSNLQ